MQELQQESAFITSVPVGLQFYVRIIMSSTEQLSKNQKLCLYLK